MGLSVTRSGPLACRRRRPPRVVLVALVAVWLVTACAPPADVGDPEPSRVVVIGDSYTGGSDQGGAGDAGWPAVLWATMSAAGVAVTPTVSGRGGSGYLRRGVEGTVFGDEVARLVTAEDDAVIFFGGLNDASMNPDSLRAAADAAFAATRALAPCARVIVVGPAWLRSPGAEVLRVRDVLQAAATRVGATFVDPLAQRWLQDDPALAGADGVHPTDAGHAVMADRLEPVLAEALRAPPPCDTSAG